MDIRFDRVDIVRQVDESDNVDSKLSKHRTDDVNIENVGLRSLLGETFHRLLRAMLVLK